MTDTTARAAASTPVRVNPVLRHPSERRTSLDGEWRFRLDPRDEGSAKEWFNKPRLFRDRIMVPGCWQGQGFGHDGTDEVWDFRLKLRTYRATYKGTGWYGKTFAAPKEWRGQRIWLNFGGVHPSADVWLNGRALGTHSGPFVPFGYDITDRVDWDGENLLVVRVHERDRWMGHTFNWQGNWSGLFRSVELTATGAQWIDECRILPDVDGGRLRLRLRLGTSGVETPAAIDVAVTTPAGEPVTDAGRRLRSAPDGRRVSFDVPMDSPLLWSPDEPNLYHVHVTLRRDHGILAALSERVGFVKLSTRGKHFLINDEPYYMRGSGDFVINPETGSPDTCRERWRRKLRALRDYGYNYVRLQSYAAAPEYYDAADEVGLLVQSEMGMLGAWGGRHAAQEAEGRPYAWPQPSPEFYPALKWQWDRTVLRDVNHPSANIYCMANELNQRTEYPKVARECYRDTKHIKPSAFVIWSDGNANPCLPADFANDQADTDGRWDIPLIQHEFRWWTSYPDVRIKEKYAHAAVRPIAIELAQDAAARCGMNDLLPTIAANSQRLQYIEARGKMEACRRDNARLAGICHFNAMDAGLSPQGVVDEFYDRKHVDADTWRRTNGDTVMMIGRDFGERVLACGDTVEANLFVSDFSHQAFRRPVVEWQWLVRRRVAASGRVRFAHKPFRVCRAGRVRFKTPDLSKPTVATLRATLREGNRSVANEWTFWVFPSAATLPTGVMAYRTPEDGWLSTLKTLGTAAAADLTGGRPPRVVASETVDEAVVGYVANGGRVLLSGTKHMPRCTWSPRLGLSVGRYFFTRPANYPPYEAGNTGTIIADHPMLRDFPHEGFADLQFYRMIAESPPLDLTAFGPAKPKPVIRSLGCYTLCQPRGYLVEYAVGRGRIIVCALDLNPLWPEARWLLSAICRYAAGQVHGPCPQLSETSLKRMTEMTSTL